MNKDLCGRCGKETDYDINYPVDLRKWYIEGAGQLCQECWLKLWPAIHIEKENDVTNSSDK